MTISDLLAEQAQRRPGNLALIDDRSGESLTFGELESAVTQAADWWIKSGIHRGSAVLVFVPMSAELYVALLSLFRVGAVALFLDPAAGRKHLESCCAQWPPDALFAISKAHLLRLKSPALRRIPRKIHVGWWVPGSTEWPTWQSTRSGASKNSALPTDAALVTFTSGSTGEPKAAVRTHEFLLAQYRALAPNLELVAGEVDLATLPVFVLANLAAAVTTVIPAVDLRAPGSVDGGKLFAQIERRNVTRISASPAFFECLVRHGKKAGRTLPDLKKIFTGGAPVFPRLLRELRTLAPNASVVAVYGSTEAEPIAHIEVAEITEEDLTLMRRGRGLLAGRPVALVKLAILDDQFGQPRGAMFPDDLKRATLPTGTVGEIVVAGDHVLKGYLGGRGDAETKFNVGTETWHRTGDAGCFDDQGRVWLHGRCSARIDDEHGRLYPFGVECAAMAYPEVERAAALLHQRRRLLVIQAKGNADLERRLLADVTWAQIDQVAFLEVMPVDKRHNAKIDYPALREWLLRRG